MHDIMDVIKTKLQPYTSKEIDEVLVETISNVYHKYESAFYDAEQLSPSHSINSWQFALDALQTKVCSSIRVLDYGAGTGFATLQVLKSAIGPYVTEVVCYDLSPAMIAICKSKMQGYPKVNFQFLSDVSGREKLAEMEPFDLVVTNAILHHLLNVDEFLQGLVATIKPNGFYIAGHEPNRNFYFNDALISATLNFQKFKKVAQKLTITYLMQKLGLKRHNYYNLFVETNNELLQKGLINLPLPGEIMQKLVDIHVPFGLSTSQLWGEMGFNEASMLKWLGNSFAVEAIYTYSHIKDVRAVEYKYWQRKIEKLSMSFPNDGADFLIVFKRLA